MNNSHSLETDDFIPTSSGTNQVNFTFNEIGSFTFNCGIHRTGMTGTMLIEDTDNNYLYVIK